MKIPRNETLTAEAGAASVMTACAAQLRTVASETGRVIDRSSLGAERKSAAREALQRRLDLVEPRVAERIRRYRATTASLAR